jgi:very-short-patch-repair endonuclease
MRGSTRIQFFARALRSEMTVAERHLWRCLRRRQIDGHRFRRQHPYGDFILDFFCVEIGLAIELDGGQHVASVSDARRDELLSKRGVKVLRYWNDDVLQRTEEVLEDIGRHCAARCPHPDLPP